MALSDTLQAAGFESMPFRIVPPSDMENIIWAGDQTIINKLTQAAKSPAPAELGTSEAVVLIGEYGSGKTNALKFLMKQLRESGLLAAYLIRPSVSDKSTWADLVREIFTSSFQRADIEKRLSRLRRDVIDSAKEKTDSAMEGEEYDKSRETTLNQQYTRELCESILPEMPGFVQFAMDLGDPDKSEANWRYLTSKLTQQQASTYAAAYGVPVEGMASDHAAGLLLAYFIRVITYPTKRGAGSSVVYIFIDEAENLIDMPPAARRTVLLGLRDLVNFAPEHLFLAVAVTASDASELWGILDQPFMMRLSRSPYEFPQHTPQNAHQFLLDVMGQYRVQGFSGTREFPFSPDGLDAFVTSCPAPLTPRKLLVSAQRVVFQQFTSKLMAGNLIDANDIADFSDWGTP